MDISTMSALHTWCNISFTRFDPVSLVSLLSTCLVSSVAFFEKQRYNKGFQVRMWQIWIRFYQSDPVLWLSKQNLCFILPQFLYQFFCGYSQQVSASPRNHSLFVCCLFVVRRRCEQKGGGLLPSDCPSLPVLPHSVWVWWGVSSSSCHVIWV